MGNTLQAVHLLEERLEKLVSNYKFLREENEILYKNNAKLLLSLEESKQELENQKKKYDLLRIAKTIEGSEEDKKDTKLKINTLIREIDKCIVQLNS